MKKTIKNLWYGNYSLKKTYWFYGNIIPLIFFIILLLLSLFFQDNPLDALLNLKFSPEKIYQKIILLTIILMFFVYSIVSTVGIWRSANKFEGKKYWSILAKITIFLALFSYIKDIYKFFL